MFVQARLSCGVLAGKLLALRPGAVVRRGLIVGPCLVLAVLFVVVPGSASASGTIEAKPFGVTEFSMQTTAPTKILPTHEGHKGSSEEYEIKNEPEAFAQAGGHPWALTTTVEFATEEIEREREGGGGGVLIEPTRDPKDIVVDLPPGLLGDPQAMPRCPLATALGNNCPSATQIGEYRIRWFGEKEFLGPIVNVVPEAGQSAEFVLENEVHANPILTAHLVRTAEGVDGCAVAGGCYGFTVVSNAIPQVEISRVETTFWGVPADPSHDAMRGLSCANVDRNEHSGLSCEGNGGHAAGVAEHRF